MLTLAANMICKGVCSQYHCELIPLISIFVTSVVYENHNLAPVGQFVSQNILTKKSKIHVVDSIRWGDDPRLEWRQSLSIITLVK